MINNKIKLHILLVPMNKLGNWLMIDSDGGGDNNIQISVPP